MNTSPLHTPGSLDTTHLDGLLDKRGVAKLLNTSTRTVDNWMRLKRLPYLKCGAMVRFRWSDVLEHLGQYRVN